MYIPEQLSNENNRAYALRVIKNNIINLELAPGSQISENELAAQMGLSRTPVREALLELSKVKIVTIVPQKKSEVSLIDHELVEESCFMRNILESAVAELDCQLATPEDIARLRENIRLQHFYLNNFYSDNLLPLDNQFHSILFDIARKSQVFTLINQISIHFDRVRTLALASVKNTKIVEDHEAIVEAIAQRDAPLARDLMEKHLNRYDIDVDKLREEYPQYFK